MEQTTLYPRQLSLRPSPASNRSPPTIAQCPPGFPSLRALFEVPPTPMFKASPVASGPPRVHQRSLWLPGLSDRVDDGPAARRYSCTRRFCEQFGRDILRSEEHTSELQSLRHLVCRLLLEKKERQ